MAQSDTPEDLLLAALRRHAGEAALNARITPMEWVNLAREIGLSDKARNAAIACLRETGLIVYKPESTEIIALTLAGIHSGDRLIRSKPKLTDPMPNSLEDIQYELDYWEIRLQEGQPGSDWWHGVKARIEGLRHRESRFLPGISITNNAIGANSRINQNSIDQSTNAVSGTISGTAEHDPSLLHTGFRKRGETVSAMAFRPLKSFFPTADELLQQDLPTLGKALLAHLQSYKSQNTVYQHAGLNRGYFRAMLENRSIGLGPLPKEPEYQARQPEVTRRMMEAWTWLERQGLLIHNDEQVADWFNISSDGEKCLNQDEVPTCPLPNTAGASRFPADAPRAFLSYAWENTAHQLWVRAFAERLQGESGIVVTFDQWDLRPGDDKLHFMERGVASADFVIVVCTPAYAERANRRSGGVGYESMVITAELAERIATNKFIPVLRTGTWASAMPIYLKSRLGVNLSGEHYNEGEYERLLRAIHREPMQAPPIGKKPDFSKERNLEGIQIPKEPPPFHSAFPAEGEDGSHRDLVRYIMCGHDLLLAYTTTRDGLPGTRFLVVRQRPDQDPQSVSAPDRETANAKWTEWYREWKQRGFGGASGNFDGDPPF